MPAQKGHLPRVLYHRLSEVKGSLNLTMKRVVVGTTSDGRNASESRRFEKDEGGSKPPIERIIYSFNHPGIIIIKARPKAEKKKQQKSGPLTDTPDDLPPHSPTPPIPLEYVFILLNDSKEKEKHPSSNQCEWYLQKRPWPKDNV